MDAKLAVSAQHQQLDVAAVSCMLCVFTEQACMSHAPLSTFYGLSTPRKPSGDSTLGKATETYDRL